MVRKTRQRKKIISDSDDSISEPEQIEKNSTKISEKETPKPSSDTEADKNDELDQPGCSKDSEEKSSSENVENVTNEIDTSAENIDKDAEKPIESNKEVEEEKEKDTHGPGDEKYCEPEPEDKPESSKQDEEKLSEVEEAGISSTSDNIENSQEATDDPVKSPETDKEDSSTESEKPKIRLIPIEQLLKPDIVLKHVNQDDKISTTTKSQIFNKPSVSNRNIVNTNSSKNKRNSAPIVISDSSDESSDDEPQLIDDSSDEKASTDDEVIVKRMSSRRNKQKKSVNNDNGTNSPDKIDLSNFTSPRRILRERGTIKELSVNLSKMPNNVNKMMRVYKVNDDNGAEVLSSQTSAELEMDDIESMISTTKIEKTKSKPETELPEPDSQTLEDVTSTTDAKRGKKTEKPKSVVEKSPIKPVKVPRQKKAKEEPKKKEPAQPTRRSGRSNRPVAIFDLSSESSSPDDSSDDEASSSTVPLKSRVIKNSQSNNVDREPIKPLKITRQMLQSPSKKPSSNQSQGSSGTEKNVEPEPTPPAPEEKEKENDENTKQSNLKITIKLNKNSSPTKVESNLEKEEVTPEKSKKLTHTKKSPRKENPVEMVISSSDESEKETHQKSRSPRKRKTDNVEVIQPRTTRNSMKKADDKVGTGEKKQEEDDSESKKETDDDEIDEKCVVDGSRSRTKVNPLFKDLKEKFEAKKKKRSSSLDVSNESKDKTKGCKDSVDISTSDKKNDDSDEENEKKSLYTKPDKSSKTSRKSTSEKPTESDRKTRGRSKPIKDAEQTENIVYSNENVSNENDEVEENGNAANEIDPLNDGDEEEPIRRKEKKVKKKRVISSTESESEDNPKKKRKMNSSSDENEQKESSSSSSSSSSDESEKSRKGDKKVTDESDEEDFKPKKSKRKKPPSDSDDSDDEDDMLDKDRPKVKRKRIKKMASSDEDGDKNDKDKSKGRKNIRKLIKKLDVSTKEAAKTERERKQRIEERQKLYNQVYDEKPEAVKELTSLVLDFDEKTKKPLLEVDKKLVKQLKPHQANGIKFMWDACFESLARCKKEAGSGCILAHCMGLGKTLQVITLVHTLLMNSEKTKMSKVLVVCPLSTVLNWVNEFDIWLKNIDRSDEIYIYEISKLKQNVDRANRLMEWHNDGGVMIMGYDMFRNLTGESIKIRKKVRESLNYTLLDPGPDLIICDEGHLLKNEKTSISKSMNRIQTLRRIVLTGTPLQNNLKEYYCMVQFVKPNLLGKYQEYMNRFVNPITNGQYTDSTQYDIQLMKRRSHVLHKMLDGCVQRRDYGVLTPFLPPKHEYIVSIKLTPMQISLYKYYMEKKSRSNDEGVAKRASVLFQDFQNLQRIWTAPRVLRYNSDKYELEQQKRRDMESDEESIGSIKDFLDDEDSASSTSSGSSSGTESDDEGSVQSINSDEPLKKSKKKKKESSQTVGRRTRATASSNIDEELETLELENRKENPTEWWMQICPETELDNLEHSSKLVLLMAILEQCEAIGDKLLVFSQSLYSLDVIEHFLNLIDEKTQQELKVDDENETTETDGKAKTKFTGSWSLGLDYFRLDGSTSVEQRNASCKSFNHPENHRARLFLISTRAGGLGINLVAANRVIIFDASWNPSHDIQSIFRVYRFGQTKPCYIYRFLALGTMEEKIYERQVTKQAISKRVIDEQQIDRHYNQNDLQELYRYDLEPDEERILPLLPKDRLFAELLKRYDNLIYKYHEHDTLLENKEEETLNEEERKMAWEEYEQEKNRPQYVSYVPQTTRGIGPVTSNNIFGIRTDVLLKLLSMKARMDNPTINEFQVKQVIPLLMQELYRQMGNGDMTLYSQLIALSSNLEVPTNYGGSIGLTNGSSSVSLGAGNSGISSTKYSAQPSTSMNNYYKQQHLQRKIAEQQSRFNQMKRPPPTINGPVIEIDD